MRPIKFGMVAVALLAALVIPAPVQAQESDERGGVFASTSAFEIDGAAAAIESGDGAHVLVSLALPPAVAAGDGASAFDLESLKRDVAAVQGSVLNSVADGGGGLSGRWSAEVEVRRQFDAVPALAMTVRSQSALEELARHPNVVGIRLDTGGTGSLDTSVPLVGADERHAVGNNGDGVTVAVLDSGVDLDHPDLVDDVLATQICFGDTNGSLDGVGFCPNGSDRQSGVGAGEDDAGHGTHVAGIISSAGTVSSPGAAPGAEIVSVKITDDCTFAGCFYFFSEILASWDWIIINNDTLGIDVMNMSFGTNARFAGNCDGVVPAAATAIATLRSLGITPFASAGNSGTDEMGAPACLSGVVAVGASNNSDNVAGFTDSNTNTDVFAPGVSIVSLAIGGGTTGASGTSMASPHAAGCAALLIEAGDAMTPDAVEARLETSSFQVTDRAGLSFPRIDCTDLSPVASIGGPYSTNEGVDVALDAGASTDPEGQPLLIEWDLDADGSFDDADGAAANFDTVGQDGVFPIAVRVTDAAAQSNVDQSTVTVGNVAPTVAATSNAPVALGSEVTISGSVSDPGWLDPLTATVDWGDGTPVEAVPGLVENTRPDATLSFDVSHTYGDAGVYSVEVCGSDDDVETCTTVAPVAATGLLGLEIAKKWIGTPVDTSYTVTSSTPGCSSAAASLTAGEASTMVALNDVSPIDASPCTYTLAETDVAGYDRSAWNCVAAAGGADAASIQVNGEADAIRTNRCEITNQQLPSPADLTITTSWVGLPKATNYDVASTTPGCTTASTTIASTASSAVVSVNDVSATNAMACLYTVTPTAVAGFARSQIPSGLVAPGGSVAFTYRSTVRCAGRIPDLFVGPSGTIVGTAKSEVIVGTAGADVIDGGGGNDIICGLGGDDTLTGGSARDFIYGGGGNDTIHGGGTADAIWGGEGNDTIYGEGGSDRIRSGNGDDIIRAGSGADRVWAGAGDDEIFGQGGQDWIWAEAGNDTVQGNWQSDRIWGGLGDDVLRGADGKDKVYGGPGNDLLFGGNNTDFLDGGPGTDTANGQKGRDRPLVVIVSGCIAETLISC